MNIRGVPQDEGRFEKAARESHVGAANYIDWEIWPDFSDIKLVVNQHEYQELRPFMKAALTRHFVVSTPCETSWLYERYFEQKQGDPFFVSDPSANPDRQHMSRRGFYWPGEED